ncbi:DNA polymerase III subunit delta [Sporomusa acidovorans]|uniref:DNA polymerase III subunit delta n=1 Tax=Sporomusa acidovorans (strain ATCC 49682 / DSM 3132 / Mol) TaxID=1123286 RepID=A0ABZ3J3R3_SPOA4|nr:DNA polymerase III subunit delta [Sporomusa acidovorans]OZC23102.1 DNA polymerase III subunit delta [Sporomusa acidovorans DSM 3132]SDF05568.1 DNA polymerase III, delta subunit [Sporomusa acidovorans]
MDYKAVLAAIKQHKIASLYLLYGEEAYHLRQVEQALINSIVLPEDRDMNLIVFESDPKIEELINTIETMPFLGGKNLIIVHNTGLFSSGRKASGGEVQDKTDAVTERLIAVFSQMPNYSHAVFITPDKPDKRRKLFKVLEKNGVILEAAPLRGKELRGWLAEQLTERKIKMAPDAQEHLLAAVSMMPQVSLDFISNELEKVLLYAADKKVVTRQDLLQILSAVPEVSIFAMVEALSGRQTAQALALLREQLSTGEHPIRILALLARQVRQLWQAKELVNKGHGSREVAEYFKVPGFIGEKLVKQSRNFSNAKLKAAMLGLAAADRDLKASRSGAVVLEKIIIELCE